MLIFQHSTLGDHETPLSKNVRSGDLWHSEKGEMYFTQIVQQETSSRKTKLLTLWPLKGLDPNCDKPLKNYTIPKDRQKLNPRCTSQRLLVFWFLIR